jgi:hypothetical protein
MEAARPVCSTHRVRHARPQARTRTRTRTRPPSVLTRPAGRSPRTAIRTARGHGRARAADSRAVPVVGGRRRPRILATASASSTVAVGPAVSTSLRHSTSPAPRSERDSLAGLFFHPALFAHSPYRRSSQSSRPRPSP